MPVCSACMCTQLHMQERCRSDAVVRRTFVMASPQRECNS